MGEGPPTGYQGGGVEPGRRPTLAARGSAACVIGVPGIARMLGNREVRLTSCGTGSYGLFTDSPKCAGMPRPLTTRRQPQTTT
jgi:hypothetical protein